MTFRKRKKWQIVLLLFGALIALLFLFLPKVPETPKSVASIAEFERHLQRLTDFGTPPGMSFVVVKNGQIVYSKGFGWADRPRRIPASPETAYHWWSCTKIATGIAILQLQERGLLRLDDSVTQYLPFFMVQYPNAESPSGIRKVITIRNLLNHSSGLPDPGFRIIGWIHHDGEPAVNQTALVEKVLPDYSELGFEPGDHAEYTNIGYMVLGAIIERVTGKTYEDYIRDNILQPLGMKHTDFLYTGAMEQDEAAGAHPVFNLWTPLVPFVAPSFVREISGSYIWLKRVYTDQTPSTALIGSASDAARLVAAYLRGGELEGRRILSRELIDTMTHKDYVKGKDDNPLRYRRQGLCWQIYNDTGRLMIKHEGGGLGFSTIIELLPDENLGFVLFTNDVTCEGWRITNLAATLSW